MNRLGRLVILLAAACLLAAPAQAAEGVKLLGQPGHFPIKITVPGTYRLRKNLTVPDANTTAILVQASDVTIDLNGFAIFGPCTGGPPCSPMGSGDGVDASAAGVSNIAIRNGTIRGMGRSGISIQGGRVEGVTAASNGAYGIFGPHTVTNSSAALNGSTGIVANGPVSGCAAAGNIGNGIDCNSAGSVTNSLAQSNGNNGFYNCLTVSASTANSNGGNGIQANVTPPLTIPFTVVTGSIADGNSLFGMVASTVANSTAVSNFIGISAATVSGCTASANVFAQIGSSGLSGHNTCNGSACP